MNLETVFFVNSINKYNLRKKDHYKFLTNAIRTKKRFFNYPKKKNIEDLNYIMTYYNINADIALKYLDLLTDKQIKEIKKSLKPIL